MIMNEATRRFVSSRFTARRLLASARRANPRERALFRGLAKKLRTIVGEAAQRLSRILLFTRRVRPRVLFSREDNESRVSKRDE